MGYNIIIIISIIIRRRLAQGIAFGVSLGEMALSANSGDTSKYSTAKGHDTIKKMENIKNPPIMIKKKNCEVCERSFPGEVFPFERCWYCKATPSFHHGRCCREQNR